jgi:signal peptide peptidase SppA
MIEGSSLQTILGIVNMRMEGKAFSDEEIRIRLDAANKDKDKRAKMRVQVGGGVGVVSLYGPMFPKANLMTALSGATSLEAFRSDLQMLANDDSVKQIVIDFNTPGGSADMVSETGDYIKQIAADKPVYGIANTAALSGGLWLLSQCTKCYATPSGQVGSLGVYNTHVDQSEQNRMRGIKVTYISAGKFKTAGNPDEALTPEAKQYRQEHVDVLYEDFKTAVADGRNQTVDYVEENFGQGKILTPKIAKEVGMIDEIMSMDSLLGNLVNMNSQSKSYSGLAASVTSMAIETGGMSYSDIGNVATAFGFSVEEKEWGHSEPGTGPTPRTKEDGSDDPAIKGGWRRDTPPPGLDAPQEDEAMAQTMEEFLASFAQSIGLDANADADTVLAEAKKMSGEVAQLRELDADIENRKSFAQEYPDIAKRLEASEARGRRADAKEFRDRYSRFTVDGEDGTKIRTNQGFPSVVLDKVEAGYVSLVEGDFTVEMLSGMLDSIAKAGTVEYGELGTKLAGEDGLGNLNTETDPKAKFATRVNQYMESDNLDRHAALRMAAEKHPDEYEAYRAATPVVK